MGNLNIVCFGEILWDNLKEGRRLGGAPLNVCYHLNKMSIRSTLVTQIGSDLAGRDILAELKKLGVNKKFCAIKQSKATSTVEVIINEQQDISYDIVEDVAWDYIESSPEIEELVANSSALVFGSLIARNKVSHRTLLQLIQKSRFRVFDVNLRQPFYSKELIYSLLKETDLLKLNADEMQVISSWLTSPYKTMDKQVEYIQTCFPNIKEIILTRGSQGAIYFSGSEQIKVDARPVKIKDTVGSGDAFLAGFLALKMKGKPIRAALEQASILSSFIASQSGACPVYTANDLCEI